MGRYSNGGGGGREEEIEDFYYCFFLGWEAGETGNFWGGLRNVDIHCTAICFSKTVNLIKGFQANSMLYVWHSIHITPSHLLRGQNSKAGNRKFPHPYSTPASFNMGKRGREGGKKDKVNKIQSDICPNFEFIFHPISLCYPILPCPGPM